MKNPSTFILLNHPPMQRTLTLSLLFLSLFASAQNTYQKLYVTVNGSQTSSIKHTNDGGFISSGGSSSGYWVIKADHDGAVQWAKNLTNAYRIFSIRQTADGGFAGCGHGSNGAGKTQAMLVKFSPTGAIQWSKIYGDTANSSATDLEQTADGGYIMSGTIGSVATLMDVYAIRTDSAGNLLWANRYASASQVADITSSVIEANGSYYISGNIQFSTTSADALVMKINGNGTALWACKYDAAGFREFANEIMYSSGGKLLVVGYNEPVYLNTNISLTQLDTTNGLINWNFDYGSPGLDYGFSLYQNPDQSVVMAGSSDSSSGGNSSRDVILMKVGITGNIIWCRQYGGSGLDLVLQNCLDKTTDGGFLVQATSLNSFSTALNRSTYVLKTDADGEAGCNSIANGFSASQTTLYRTGYLLTQSAEGNAQSVTITSTAIGSDTTLCAFSGIEEMGEQSSGLQLYPNPASAFLNISCTDPLKQISIYNIEGKLLSTESRISGYTGVIDVHHLASGRYLIKAITLTGMKTASFTRE